MFTGRQFEEETGLYFYRARSYDSIKGRFLQRDPIEYVTSMNQYEYAGSAPTVFTDPSGMVCCSGPIKSLCGDMEGCPEGQVCKWVPAEGVGGGGIAEMLGNCGCKVDWKEWKWKELKKWILRGGKERFPWKEGKEGTESRGPRGGLPKDPEPPRPLYDRPPFSIKFW
jgi:RHS repeat-associated protein